MASLGIGVYVSRRCRSIVAAVMAAENIACVINQLYNQISSLSKALLNVLGSADGDDIG